MKKVILAAAALAVVGLTKVKANSVNHNQHIVAVASQDSVQKTPVKLEDLPAPVKTALASEALKVWTPTSALLVKSGTVEYYQVNVKKDAEEKYIKLDKDGKVVQ